MFLSAVVFFESLFSLTRDCLYRTNSLYGYPHFLISHYLHVFVEQLYATLSQLYLDTSSIHIVVAGQGTQEFVCVTHTLSLCYAYSHIITLLEAMSNWICPFLK